MADAEQELRAKVEARWSGTVAYRSLVRRERLEELWKDHRASKELIFVSLPSYSPASSS